MIKRGGPVGAQTAGLLSCGRPGLLRTGSVLFREQRQGQRKSVDNRLDVSQVFLAVQMCDQYQTAPGSTSLSASCRLGFQVGCAVQYGRNGRVRLTRL